MSVLCLFYFAYICWTQYLTEDEQKDVCSLAWLIASGPSRIVTAPRALGGFHRAFLRDLKSEEMHAAQTVTMKDISSLALTFTQQYAAVCIWLLAPASCLLEGS